MITNLCIPPEGVRVEKTLDHHLSYGDGFPFLYRVMELACQILSVYITYASK